MTCERRVVAENYVLHDRLAGTNGLEEVPEVRPQIIVVVALNGDAFGCGLLAGCRVVLLVPFFYVRVPEASRIRSGVVAGRCVHTGLGSVRDAEFAQLEGS